MRKHFRINLDITFGKGEDVSDENMKRALEDILKERQGRIDKRKKQVRKKITAIVVVLVIFLAMAGAAAFILFREPEEMSAEGNVTEYAETEDSPKESPERAVATVTDSGISAAVDNKVEKNSEASSKGNDGNAASVTDALIAEATPADAKPVEKDFTIELSFVGDCCLASDKENRSEGTMLWYQENYPDTYFFEKVSCYFTEDDFTVANCENTFSDNPGVMRDKGEEGGFWFKSPAVNAGIFKAGGVDAVSICNNHTMDYGEEVFEDTKAALEAAGVQWGCRDHIVYYEKEGFRIAVICSAFYNYQEVYETEKYFREAEQNSDFQIVYFHGGIEHQLFVDDWKRLACRYLVDCGVDLILGAHPHCLQPVENYNGVDIIYSLGNFCFGGNNYPQPNRTIIYKYYLDIHQVDEEFSLVSKRDKIIPCYIYTGDHNNWQPAPIEDKQQAEMVISFLKGDSESPQ